MSCSNIDLYLTTKVSLTFTYFANNFGIKKMSLDILQKYMFLQYE